MPVPENAKGAADNLKKYAKLWNSSTVLLLFANVINQTKQYCADDTFPIYAHGPHKKISPLSCKWIITYLVFVFRRLDKFKL